MALVLQGVQVCRAQKQAVSLVIPVGYAPPTTCSVSLDVAQPQHQPRHGTSSLCVDEYHCERCLSQDRSYITIGHYCRISKRAASRPRSNVSPASPPSDVLAGHVLRVRHWRCHLTHTASLEDRSKSS